MKELVFAEVLGGGRHKFAKLDRIQKSRLLELSYIHRIAGTRIYFSAGTYLEDIKNDLEQRVFQVFGDIKLEYHTLHDLAASRLEQKLTKAGAFESLTFGSDVAEHDEDLLNYFISTKAFQRVQNREKSVIIGPKGSGKSAILKALMSKGGGGYYIVITPEVFATSMLRQFVEGSAAVWDEEEAFVSTWIFTILVEVFKRICDNSRGVPEKALKRIRQFLRDNSRYEDMDLFTRFIGYLRAIQNVKVGEYEVTIKTRMLQDLYALEEVYELIPGLREGLREDINILIDELDQGWDNSAHSNRFLASLLQAAIRIQRLGLRVHVVVFIRSEIFDLVKYQLDQLDKLRSSIEVLKWKREELGALVLKRIDYCLGAQLNSYEYSLLTQLMPEPSFGMQGFDFLLSRTTKRPREVLQFVRQAHRIAVENNSRAITREALMKAEEDFSSWKIEHLCSEYRYIFPGLQGLLWSFRGYGPVLSSEDVLQVVQRYLNSLELDELPPWAQHPLKDIVQNLYLIDFLGVSRMNYRQDSAVGILGRYEFGYESPSANVKVAEKFLIHPAFWNVLEITAVY